MTNKQRVEILKEALAVYHWNPFLAIVAPYGICAVMSSVTDVYAYRWDYYFPEMYDEIQELVDKRNATDPIDRNYAWSPHCRRSRRKFLRKWIKYYKELDKHEIANGKSKAGIC